MRVGFIQGIMHRCGTNYLHHLLKRHPDVATADDLPENYLLTQSDRLVQYVDETFDIYTDAWQENPHMLGKADLLGALGEGLLRHLQRQHEAGEKAQRGAGNRSLLLTKTPSVRCLQYFFELFPDERLILLVREGRAVVESAHRTFGWDHVSSMHRWAERAGDIRTFIAGNQARQDQFVLVRYEDLVADPRGQIRRCLEVLKLDASAYDFDGIEAVGVIGSSEVRKGGGAMHWKPVPRPPGFNPLARAEGWTDEQNALFERVAGGAARSLGYR